MIKRITHGIIALVAVILGVVTHLMIQDTMDGQVTAQSITFMTSHALVMASVVWRHAKLAVQGLKFQSPILASGG